GRLDKDTEGLLLITDDGALSHALMSPNRHVEKEYEAVVDGALAADAVSRFEQGMTLRDGTECKSAKLEILETEPELRVRVTLKEGKYHQVKRMIAAVGGTVTALKRLRLGGLWLDKTLAPGEFRELTQEELEKLTSQT
ncbi:MAG: pseudouridine synthase, partial [Butyricicoccus sp.]